MKLFLFLNILVDNTAMGNKSAGISDQNGGTKSNRPHITESGTKPQGVLSHCSIKHLSKS